MSRTITEHFLTQVEAFLVETGTKPTEFGRCAVGDASFVLNLRRGRSPTLATADKVLAYIASFEAGTSKSRKDRRFK
jgi:predicted transcriptional regulator